MRIALMLFALAAFGQDFRPLPVLPDTTASAGAHYVVAPPLSRAENVWWNLGSPGYPWPCSDKRIKTAKPGQYRHIYCTTKSGVLLMDGKPVKR